VDLRQIGGGVVVWIYLAQDRDRWWAVVNAVMKLRVLLPRSSSVDRNYSYVMKFIFMLQAYCFVLRLPCHLLHPL
jgi:hypothetical protein